MAIALLLILEGIFPFINPSGMRRTLQTISQLPDPPLRLVGLTSMLLGLVLLYIIN
ncbi:MAG: DUF2065 domain-containing protein [Acidiferrobacterales bacterium]